MRVHIPPKLPWRFDSQHGDFICPKCRNTLEEVIHLRLQEQRPLPSLWERYSTPIRLLDPPVLPEYPASALSRKNMRVLKNIPASPPAGGYVAIVKDPIVNVEEWHDLRISTMEGVSRCRSEDACSDSWHQIISAGRACQRLKQWCIVMLCSVY